MSAPPKEERLVEYLGARRGVLVAFSGGVDSSYLAFVANRVLDSRAVAVTALSPAVSTYQRQLAANFAQLYGLRHQFMETSELEDPRYASNPRNRCYFCKTELYDRLARLREEAGLEVVLDGTNADDVGDWRPGRLAAGENGVASPLVEVGMSKQDIRDRSRHWGLPCWNLPAMPCLSSRFPYGVRITPEALAQVEEAEAILRTLGFSEFRVRHYQETARVEISPDEMARLELDGVRARIDEQLRRLGYGAVEIDPKGFRSGSLNDGLAVGAAASRIEVLDQ